MSDKKSVFLLGGQDNINNEQYSDFLEIKNVIVEEEEKEESII